MENEFKKKNQNLFLYNLENFTNRKVKNQPNQWHVYLAQILKFKYCCRLQQYFNLWL